MYPSWSVRLALASIMLLALGACRDDDSNTPDFDDSATTAETEEAAEAAADFAADIAASINFGEPEVLLGASAALDHAESRSRLSAGPLTARVRGLEIPGLTLVADRRMQFAAAPGCTIESSGTEGSDPFEPYDGNDNGIADDWHVKSKCVEVDSANPDNHVTETTEYEVTVKENDEAVWGYDAQVDYSARARDEEGDESGMELSYDDRLDIRTGAVTRKSSSSGRFFETNHGDTEEESFGEEADAHFGPDGPIVLGQDIPDGSLTFTGRRWSAEKGARSLSFDLDTPEPLAYDAGCADAAVRPPFTAGQIRGMLNGNSGAATFLVTFTDCGDYVVDTEHTSDDLATTAGR